MVERGKESGTTLPETSLIICSRNRPVLLLDLVHSILRGHHLPAEILIIDDSDQFNQALADLQADGLTDLRYIWNRSRGLSRAANTGVELARYDLLAFTQDDILVEPDWFGNLVLAQRSAGPDVVVTGRILPGEPEIDDGFAPSTVADETPRDYAGRVGQDVLYMQNAAIYRAAGDDVGWFDPDIGPGTPYPTAEDNEFGYRLLEAGYRIRYEPGAVTSHRAWRGKEDAVETAWNYGRGQGAYLAKHARLGNLYMLRRFWRLAGYMGIRSLVRVFYRPGDAYTDAVYLAGYLSAALQWRLRQ